MWVADYLFVQFQCMLGTGTDAVAAANAAFRKVDHFSFCGATFRVVAPPAIQGTSLQKNSCANPGPVVEGKTHDVKDETSAEACLPTIVLYRDRASYHDCWIQYAAFLCM